MSILPETSPKLHGLIMAGARSSQNQCDICAKLLRKYCAAIFVSAPPGQTARTLPGGLTSLPDRFTGLGPLGGILTALESKPYSAWLVVTPDHPFLDEATLDFLIESRDEDRDATAFRDLSDGQPEPLFCIYEPSCVSQILQLMEDGVTAPGAVLQRLDAVLIDPPFRAEMNDATASKKDSQLLWWIKPEDKSPR